MRKSYIVPEMDVMQFSSEIIMDSIGIVNHSGGGGGFDEGDII